MFFEKKLIRFIYYVTDIVKVIADLPLKNQH